MKQMKSIVIIPAYNPDEVLIKIVKSLVTTGSCVIVVDDGSNDECQYIFSVIQDICVVLHHHENYGKGAAIKFALMHVKNKMELTI